MNGIEKIMIDRNWVEKNIPQDATKAVLPGNVIGIDDEAFSGYNTLQVVTISAALTKIDDTEFCYLGGLKKEIGFIFEFSPTIGRWAFYGCSGLTSIEIPNSVTTIGKSAFSCCVSLTSITIPNSVTTIGEGAFFDCVSLTSITIPNSVTTIGSSAFSQCTALTSVTIPNSVTTIGSSAFSQCRALTSVTIPNSVTEIDYNTFNGCRSLTFVTIPNSVTKIGSVAFRDCSSLTFIEIPNSVTEIGIGAFIDCSSLTSIKIPSSIAMIYSQAFSGCNALFEISVPQSIVLCAESIPKGAKIIKRTYDIIPALPSKFNKMMVLSEKLGKNITLFLYLCLKRINEGSSTLLVEMPVEIMNLILLFYVQPISLKSKQSPGMMDLIISLWTEKKSAIDYRLLEKQFSKALEANSSSQSKIGGSFFH